MLAKTQTEDSNMPKLRIATMLSVASTMLLASPLSGQCAPLMPNSLVAKSATANAATLEVRYGGWHGGWRGGWGGWGWGAGLLAGAGIGAAMAAPYYDVGHYPDYDAEPWSDCEYGAHPGHYADYDHPYWQHHYWPHHQPYWHDHHWSHHRHHHWAHHH